MSMDSQGWDEDAVKLMDAIVPTLPRHADGEMIDMMRAIEACACVIGWLLSGAPEWEKERLLNEVGDAIRGNMVNAEKAGFPKSLIEN